MYNSSYFFRLLGIFFTLLAFILFPDEAAVFAAQETIKSYDQIVNLAQKLGQNQPKTRWQTVITTEAADFISFLDNERVLIGTVEWGGYLGLPKHGDIKLFNAVTGKQIWTAGREKLANGHYALLTTEPVIVIVGREDESTSFQTYDPANGSKKWGNRVKAPDQFIVTDSMDRIITLSSEGKKRRIEALDINTGKLLWKEALPADLFSENVPDALFMGNGAVYVAGQKLIKLAESNGAPLWSIDHSALTASDRVAHYSTDGILIYHSGNTALVSEEDGSVLWEETQQNSQILCALILNNKIYRILSGSGNPDKAVSGNTIQALDIKSGREIWSRHIEEFAASPLYLEKGILVFTTDKTIYGLQAGSGEPSFMAAFSENFASGSPNSTKTLRYPDIIRFVSEKLYVAREMSGIAACSFPSGTILWEQLILNLGAPAYCADTLYTTLAKAFPVSEGKGPSKTAAALSSGSRSTEISPFMRSAQSRYEYEKQRTDSVMRDSFATALDRKSVRESQSINIRTMMAQQQVDTAMGQMQAAGDLAVSIIGIQGAVKKALEVAAIQGVISRKYMELRSFMRLLQNCFQGKYYLWPFIENESRGVTMVDLETGNRYDLPFSPRTWELDLFAVDLPNFCIDPEGKSLLMVGIGLDPSKYEKQVKWKISYPKSSVLAYDIMTFDFKPETLLIQKSRERALELEKIADETSKAYQKTIIDGMQQNLTAEQIEQIQIHIAAQIGDMEKVKNLLDAGIDVNTKHPRTGLGPLTNAVIGGHVEVVILLIQRGADVNNKAQTGMSVLDAAKAFNHKGIIKLLEEAGAK